MAILSARDLADPLTFWNHVLIGDGCWEWRGSKISFGYGRLKYKGKARLAHRLAYELWHECSLTTDDFICHHCDNPPCVRPDHLFKGTQKDNIDDAVRKGRLWHGQHNTEKTHCPQGHPYDEENTYTYEHRRSCKMCHRESYQTGVCLDCGGTCDRRSVRCRTCRHIAKKEGRST